MSILERNFDLLPQRADPHCYSARKGRTWFSKLTIRRASHYDDVSWARLGVPALIAVGVFAASFLLENGNTAAFMRLAGGIAALITVRSLILKAALGSDAKH